MGTSTIEINLENFQTIVEQPGVVMLDFWAEWCGPCKVFAPVFEAAAGRHADVTFGKIDTEAQQELAQAVGIQAIPTVMVFRDGVLLFRESGALPAGAIDSIVEQARKLDMEEVKKKMAEHEHSHEHGPDCDHDHDHDDGDDEADDDEADADDDEAVAAEGAAAEGEGEQAAAATPDGPDHKH